MLLSNPKFIGCSCLQLFGSLSKLKKYITKGTFLCYRAMAPSFYPCYFPFDMFTTYLWLEVNFNIFSLKNAVSKKNSNAKMGKLTFMATLQVRTK